MKKEIKKRYISSIVIGALMVGITFPYGTTVHADSVQSDNLYPIDQVNTDNQFIVLDDYTITDEEGNIVNEEQNKNSHLLKSATGFNYKTLSQSVKKGSRTYLGKKKYKKGFDFNVKVIVRGVYVNLGGYASKTGYYKEYKQNVKITVKVKKYENGSGKYVGTYTYTSNTSYVDRIPV
ncbi:TPA: LMxysn_1693 family intestinal colonization protein [Listeria monocytogenes]